jgi:formate hydrogenlyase transcriptional activator
VEHGPKELEKLLRAVIFQPSVPILLADDDGRYQEASVGAARLLNVPRENLIGRSLEEFVAPDFKPVVSQRWKEFLQQGEQQGTLPLLAPEGVRQDVEYSARQNVLPVRHLVALRSADDIPVWAQDFAVFLLDANETVVSWYSGAQRIYGYQSGEIIGRKVSHFNAGDGIQFSEEMSKAAGDGHVVTEGWHVRKNGDRFWANAITMALKDEQGVLLGYARVVRDFSHRHERDEQLRRARARLSLLPRQPTIAGVVAGEFDQVPEVNDAFLEMTGYTREDLQAGRLLWSDLTPPEYAPQDELAHEEGLRFGACTPYEKELIRKDGTRIPVIVITSVLKLSPFRWITFVQDLRERHRLESMEEHENPSGEDFGEIVGNSPALRRMQRQVEVVAPTDANVLILGETGTGKELVARAIHRMSNRNKYPFVTLNCAAIPTGLLESELFGYERGAFTGALTQKIGRFEMANRGTLFLDEVGDIPLDLQPKLLRALQEKSFERLGGTKTIPIDVRLVAATNRNLTQMMGDKLFRSDLYYRLKVFPITTPPLRDHPEDIPVLARHFTKKYAQEMNKQIDKIPIETMRALASWTWPGNVRELENFIERSVILSRGPNLRAPLSEIRADAAPAAGSTTLEQVEREHIVKVLRECNGVVTAAAKMLGLHRTTLNAIMRKLGITRKEL